MHCHASQTNRLFLTALARGFAAAPAWWRVINQNLKRLTNDIAAADAIPPPSHIVAATPSQEHNPARTRCAPQREELFHDTFEVPDTRGPGRHLPRNTRQRPAIRLDRRVGTE